jgi:hypothetical protein
MTKLKNWDSHEPPDRNLCGGEISIFPLPHPLYASLAPARTPLSSVLMAGFAKLPFFHDARLGSFPFNPACLSEGFAPLCRRPFPDWLAFASFPAIIGISIKWGEG